MEKQRVHPVAALVVALLLLFTFTGVYVTAFHQPRPNGLDVGVVGQSAGLQQALGAGFDVRAYGSEPAARRGLSRGDVHGVLVPGPHTATVLLAGPYGPASAAPVEKALTRAAHARGMPARVGVYKPLPAHDEAGLSSLFTTFGTALPSLVLGALLALVATALRPAVRWLVLVAFAALAGIVAALSVDTVVGALTGSFWGLAGVASLLALAVSALTFGLGRLAGPPGVVAAVVVVVLLGQSSTGGALTSQLQPGFYNAISGLLPNGAALTALRNTIYFGGAHTAVPLLVLCAWAAAGLCLGLIRPERSRQ